MGQKTMLDSMAVKCVVASLSLLAIENDTNVQTTHLCLPTARAAGAAQANRGHHPSMADHCAVVSGHRRNGGVARRVVDRSQTGLQPVFDHIFYIRSTAV